jgi:hypothetical protein
MNMRSINTAVLVWVFVLVVASASLLAQEQTPDAQERTPAKKHDFAFQIDMGGVFPMGQTRSSGGYNSSLMIGGGFGVPLKKWISWDMADLDFGFGTTNQSQTIEVSNGTTAKTANYQILFGTGARVNLPVGHSAALGLGGGFASADENEYVPSQYSTIGGVTTVTSVNCTTCSHNSYTGSYFEARFYGRSDKYATAGIDAKYYMLKDSNNSLSSYTNLPPQRWLTVSFVFTFGI